MQPDEQLNSNRAPAFLRNDNFIERAFYTEFSMKFPILKEEIVGRFDIEITLLCNFTKRNF